MNGGNLIKVVMIKVDKIDQSDDDCIENPINGIIQNNQPLGKKPVENI